MKGNKKFPIDMRFGILALLSLFSFPVLAQNDQVWKTYEETVALFNSNNFSGAAEKAKAGLALGFAPKDSSVYYELNFLLGISYLNLGNTENSVPALQKAEYYYSSRPEEENYLSTLAKLGEAYFMIHDLAGAEACFKKAVDITGSDPGIQIALYHNLAAVYKKQNDQAKAAGVYRKIISITENNSLLQKERQMALYHLAVEEQKKGNSGEALKCLKKINPDSPALSADYLAEVNFLTASLLSSEGKLAEAEEHFLKAAESFSKINALEKTASVYFELAQALRSQGKFLDSEKYISLSLRNYEDASGKQSEQYARALIQSAGIRRITGDFSSASQNFEAAKKILADLNKKETALYATLLNNQALLQTELGFHSEAEHLFRESLGLTEKLNGKQSKDYALVLNNLGLLYLNKGSYEKAEPLLEESLDLRKKVLGINHPDFSESLNNLGSVYQELNRHKQAEKYYLEAFSIAEKYYGKQHISYATAVNNLAGLYEETGEYKKAETLYKEALQIFESILGKDHPVYAAATGNYALLKVKTGDFSGSEKLFRQELDKIKSSLGEKHPKYATALSNLAGLYENQEKYGEAEKLYEQALAIRLNELGPKNPDLGSVLISLARVKVVLKKMSEAEKLYTQAIENLQHQITVNYPLMSEKEKILFYKKLILKYDQINNFLLLRHAEDPEFIVSVLNNQLKNKALIFNSSVLIRKNIRKNPELLSAFEKWKNGKEKLARLYGLTKTEQEQNRQSIDSLEKEINELEVWLAAGSETFRLFGKKKELTWKEIQKNLKSTEAAVEVLRIPRIHFEKGGIHTEKVSYAFFVITPGKQSQPELIIINDAVDLEKRFLYYYRNTTHLRIPDKHSYDRYWKPLASILQPFPVVYLAPDGIYNQISVSGLLNPASEAYLADEKQVRMVTSLRDLLEKRSRKSGTSAVLVGDPFLENLGFRHSLPGALSETQKINEILKRSGKKTRLITGQQATEAFVKDLEEVSVLHLATHGFFEADLPKEDKEFEIKSENPLLRSGIFLTPVDGEYPEDGKLTAYEAMNLDLTGCDLVVLSACETGLGHVENGEGVYGLQRALRVAGASSVIISLWKVDDQATKKLMEYFYEAWIKTKDKREAFQTARKKLRQEFPSPYYWAAFVISGD